MDQWAGVKGWVVGAALGANVGGPEWGEHTRTRFSDFGLWPWGPLKTILSGWPNACNHESGCSEDFEWSTAAGKMDLAS